MKKLTIVIALILAGHFAQGQYFVSESSLWSYAATPTDGDKISSFYWVQFSGDTVINGNTYKRILRSSDSLRTHWEEVGFIREDSIGRVYKIDDYYRQEVLSFDFSLGEGDSVLVRNTDYMHVDSTLNKSFGFDPTERKHVYLQYNTWIEGVGGYEGPLIGAEKFGLVGTYYQLVCYYEQGELIYHNDQFSSCFPNPTSTPQNGLPSPGLQLATGNGSVRFLAEGLATHGVVFSVLDITGRLLHQRVLAGEAEWELPTAGLPPGVYIYRLSSAGGVLAGKFYLR